MAFKPFAKPKSAAEIEAELQREEQVRLELIEARSAKVLALKMRTDLNEWENTFVNSMHYMATTYGVTGNLGENLASLTSSQVEQLERLCAKYGVTPAATGMAIRPRF